MNSNGNGWDSTKGQKCLIFIMVPLLRLKNIKERWKKNRKIYSKYKNIWKLKWLSP